VEHDFTWYAAVVAAAVMALPLLVRTARAAIESVDRDLERAALTLGRSEWRTALEVTLPLAQNGILPAWSWRSRVRWASSGHADAGGKHPRQDDHGPLAIYTAVQTGDASEVMVLVER